MFVKFLVHLLFIKYDVILDAWKIFHLNGNCPYRRGELANENAGLGIPECRISSPLD